MRIESIPSFSQIKVRAKLRISANFRNRRDLLSRRDAAGDGNKREEFMSTAIKRVLNRETVKKNLRGFIDCSLYSDYLGAFSTAELAKRYLPTCECSP